MVNAPVVAPEPAAADESPADSPLQKRLALASRMRKDAASSHSRPGALRTNWVRATWTPLFPYCVVCARVAETLCLVNLLFDFPRVAVIVLWNCSAANLAIRAIATVEYGST